VGSRGGQVPDYEIKVRSHEDRLVVVVSGDVDVVAWRDLELMADTVLVADLDLDVDLTGLTFVDGHGINELHGLVERMRERGRQVRLMSVPDHARRIINLVAPQLETLISEHDR
jgi:anti-anti-sigma factor